MCHGWPSGLIFPLYGRLWRPHVISGGRNRPLRICIHPVGVAKSWEAVGVNPCFASIGEKDLNFPFFLP
jgi:hypothetical protein